MMSIDKEFLKKQIEAISPAIAHELEREISEKLDKCGMFYRIFSRCKSGTSTVEKLIIKEEEYKEKNKKMQDLIGVRVVLYFKDDIDLCIKVIEKFFSKVEIVRDEEESEKFSPMRLNIVCEMPDFIIKLLSSEIWDFPIDKTFEIQIRTIFSEGWHEVEHDLRYKHKTDWEAHMDLSRNLNGIFATLETCDWAIINVLDQLAYKKYKAKDWDAMLRNHLRIRMDNSKLSDKIVRLFNEDNNLAKEFFKVDRNRLLLYLSNPSIHSFPKKLDNIVFLINELIIKEPKISEIVPIFFMDLVRKANN